MKTKMTDEQREAYEWVKYHQDYRSVAARHAQELVKLIDALLEQERYTIKCAQAIQQQAEEDRWISVEDRMPEEGQEVIVCLLNRFGGQKVFSTTFWNATYSLWNDATHWMPLPEPPKNVPKA